MRGAPQSLQAPLPPHSSCYPPSTFNSTFIRVPGARRRVRHAHDGRGGACSAQAPRSRSARFFAWSCHCRQRPRHSRALRLAGRAPTDDTVSKYVGSRAADDPAPREPSRAYGHGQWRVTGDWAVTWRVARATQAAADCAAAAASRLSCVGHDAPSSSAAPPPPPPPPPSAARPNTTSPPVRGRLHSLAHSP